VYGDDVLLLLQKAPDPKLLPAVRDRVLRPSASRSRSGRRSSEHIKSIEESAAQCRNTLAAPSILSVTTAGNQVGPLITAVCDAYFAGDSAAALSSALESVALVFEAATTRKQRPPKAQPGGRKNNRIKADEDHSRRATKKAPDCERLEADEEEWVSQLAVLAYHALLVQTGYGVKMPASAADCRALVGMEAACAMLLAHDTTSRQPERFLEGLCVLQLCGSDTTALLHRWMQRHATAPQRSRAKLLPIYPTVLQRIVGSNKAGAAAPIQSPRQLADVMHFHIVLVMYAGTRKHRVQPFSLAATVSEDRRLLSGSKPAAAAASADDEEQLPVQTAEDEVMQPESADNSDARDTHRASHSSGRPGPTPATAAAHAAASPAACLRARSSRRRGAAAAADTTHHSSESGSADDEDAPEEAPSAAAMADMDHAKRNDEVCAFCRAPGERALLGCEVCLRGFHVSCMTQEETEMLVLLNTHVDIFTCKAIGYTCSWRGQRRLASGACPSASSVADHEAATATEKDDDDDEDADPPCAAAALLRRSEQLYGLSALVEQVELIDPLQCFLPFHSLVTAALYGPQPRAVAFTLHWADRRSLDELMCLRDLLSYTFEGSGEQFLWPMTLGCVNHNGRSVAMKPKEVLAANTGVQDAAAGAWKSCPSSESALAFLENDAAALMSEHPTPRPPPPEDMRDRVYAKDVSFDYFQSAVKSKPQKARAQKDAQKGAQKDGFFPADDQRLKRFLEEQEQQQQHARGFLSGSRLAWLAHRAKLRRRFAAVRAQPGLLTQFHPLYLNQSPLHRRSLANLAAVDFDGVTSSYLYLKRGFQFFNLHVEQLLFTFIHYQATGSSEWFIIEAGQMDKLDKLAASFFRKLWPKTAEQIDEEELLLVARLLLFSKVMFPSVSQLRKHRIRFRRHVLSEGRCFMARGDLAHCGFSTSNGQTISLACNIVTEDSLPHTLRFLVQHLGWMARLEEFLATAHGSAWRGTTEPAAAAPELPLPADLLRKAAFFAPCNFTCSWLRGLLADLLLLLHPRSGLEPVCDYPKLQQTRRADVKTLVCLCRRALVDLHQQQAFIQQLDPVHCEACASGEDKRHDCMMCVCPARHCKDEEWADEIEEEAATAAAAAAPAAGKRKRKSAPACAAAAAAAGDIALPQSHPAAARKRAKTAAAAGSGVMDDSTQLWDEKKYGELRSRLEGDGYLFIRGVLDAEAVKHARHQFFACLLSSLCLPTATADQPTAPARKRSQAKLLTWDAQTGVLSGGRENEAAKALGCGDAMKALYVTGVHNFMTELCSSQEAAAAAAPTFQLLSDCTSMRAVLTGGKTSIHSDIGFFLQRTDCVVDVYKRLPPTARSGVCAAEMCQSDGPDEQLYACARCGRSHHRTCGQTSLLAWLGDKSLSKCMHRWHCDECLNAPFPFYTCWMPLTDLTEESSRLELIPGSHAKQGYDRMQAAGDGDDLPGDCTNDHAASSQWLAAPANMLAGDLVLFNWKLIHAASVHQDAQLRMSLDTRMVMGAASQPGRVE